MADYSNTPLASGLFWRWKNHEAHKLSLHKAAAAFAPDISVCHDRVARWVAVYPQDIAVRGWLATPTCGGVHFARHSVVRTAEGLTDITLLDGRTERVFLACDEGWAEGIDYDIYVEGY
jgi:hypothetical protein